MYTILSIPDKISFDILNSGLGRKDRLGNVIENMQLLINGNYIQKKNTTIIKNNDIDSSLLWDCIVYIYADKEQPSNFEFWSQVDDLQYLESFCTIVEHPNKKISENLLMLNRTITKSYSYVFILLDDCKLIPVNNGHNDINYNINDDDNSITENNIIYTGNDNDSLLPTFNLMKIVKVMRRNNLTVSSPQVLNCQVLYAVINNFYCYNYYVLLLMYQNFRIIFVLGLLNLIFTVVMTMISLQLYFYPSIFNFHIG